MENCLLTKYLVESNNPSLEKYGEIVIELKGEPGGNALRSGTVTVIDTSITSKARILNTDPSVKFTNQNAREFTIVNSDPDANRALGTTKDTRIGLYPGSNTRIAQFTEHVKEIPISYVYTNASNITITTTADYTERSKGAFVLETIRNIFYMPTVVSLTSKSRFAYEGSVEDLCVACSEARGGNVPIFAIHLSSAYLNNTLMTFHDEPIEAEYAFSVEDYVIKVYDIGEHIGDDNYLKGTYANGTWTYA